MKSVEKTREIQPERDYFSWIFNTPSAARGVNGTQLQEQTVTADKPGMPMDDPCGPCAGEVSRRPQPGMQQCVRPSGSAPRSLGAFAFVYPQIRRLLPFLSLPLHPATAGPAGHLFPQSDGARGGTGKHDQLRSMWWHGAEATCLPESGREA